MTDGKNPLDLTGRSILLTGGGGILGTRLTLALAAQGGRVAVVDRDGAKAAQSAAQAPGATPYDADITSPDAVRQLRDRIRKGQGDPDVLINAVAWKSEHFFEPFESFPLSDWNEVMAVNTTGVMLTCQAFGADMAARGRGSIINFLSIYGIVAPDQRIYEGSEYEGKAINTPAVYSASKAAVWGLTKYLAAYWGHRGVRVNAVTPGGVSSGQNDTFVKKYSNRVPMGRMAQKDEMSGAVLYLASDASSYVTGQNLIVDGGMDRLVAGDPAIDFGRCCCYDSASIPTLLQGVPMNDYLKGNYKLDKPAPAPTTAPAEASAEKKFEASALVKLGGSIAFIKKSSSFVWEGDKRDDAGRKPR